MASSGGRSLFLGGDLSASLSHNSSVTLDSTIREFGARDFDVRQHVVENFNRTGIHKAAAFKQTLEERRQLSANALKQYVTDNYRKFIDTSKEIAMVEGDMVTLNNMLNEYRAVVKGLMETNLDGAADDAKATTSGVASATTVALSSSSSSSSQFVLAAGALSASASALANTGTEIAASTSLSKQVQDDVAALQELAEELGGLIYERKLEQAVSIIESAYEKMDELDSKAVRASRSQVDARVAQLVEMLATDLQSASIKSGERRRVAQYLIRLGHADRALNIFLRNRSQAIRVDIRTIKFQGDLSVYVSELSAVVATAIAATCADFRRLFADRDMMSGFVVWAVSELEAFASIFQRQVFAQDTPIAKMAECLKLAFNACRTLDTLGLRLSFVLARAFTPHLAAAIQKLFDAIDADVANAIAVDAWTTAELWVRVQRSTAAASAADKKGAEPGAQQSRERAAQRAVKLTDSGKVLYDLVHRLISDVKALLGATQHAQTAADLYSPVVQGVVRMFEKYLLKMTEAARRLDATTVVNGADVDAQQLAMVANTFYLADDLLPRVCRHFERQFERPVPELEQFANKLMRLYRALCDQFCKRRAAAWVSNVWQWDAAATDHYTAPAIDQSTLSAAPSRACQRLCFFLAHLRALVLECLPGEALGTVLSKALEELLAQLAEDERYWERVVIGRGGLQQLTLDVRTTLAAADVFVTDDVLAAADALLDRATQLHCLDHPDTQPADVLFESTWFDSIISARLPPTLRLQAAPSEATPK